VAVVGQLGLLTLLLAIVMPISSIRLSVLCLTFATISLLSGCSDQTSAKPAAPTPQASTPQASAPTKGDLYAPIVLSASTLPSHAVAISGFSHAEPWGRWTDGPSARIDYAEALPKKFTLEVDVKFVYGANSAKPVTIKVGSTTVPFTFNESGKRYAIAITTDGNAKSIEWVIPAPTSPAEVDKKPDGDKRKLGIGVVSVKVTPA
jgi:hypothetical protein